MNVRFFEKNGKWWLDIRGAGIARERKSTGTSDRAEAELRAPGIVAQVLGSSSVPKSPKDQTVRGAAPRGPTLKDAYDIAMKTREQWIQSKDKETLAYTFGNLRVPEDTPMVTITRDFVRDLRVKWLAEPGKRKGTTLSASAVNSRLSMLSVLLEACDLPPHGVKHLSVKGTRRTRRMAQREIDAMQAWLCANAKRTGALALVDLITVALETAAREDEMLSLAAGDIDLEGARVTYRDTKNGETRTVPLPPASVKILERRIGLEGGPFAELTASQLKTLWAEGREALGLKEDHEFVFHTLRHEAISRLADAKVGAFTIQAIAGHSNITTTQIYVTASEEAMREAQEAVAQRALLNSMTTGAVQ
ncbi:MAG: site-specific integrase [Comamonadaceae bacterium]|nr:site-specific integrase [Comamonadaceae bacterium]